MRFTHFQTLRAASLLPGAIWILIFLSAPVSSEAQCGPPVTANCQAIPASGLTLSTPGNVNFVFDNFDKIKSGITMGGTTILRLNVLANNAACKWALRVYIDNNPGAGTPATDWEKLSTYGSPIGTVPKLNLLQFRVYNGCGTPISNGVYETFAAANGSFIDIINGMALTPAGSCATNVNGAGSYLTNYNEYTFTIDYRLVPGLAMTPGYYQVGLRFCLVEQP
jgi:hypothetical protein